MTTKPPQWETIAILCEGETEVTFIKQIVNPFLQKNYTKLKPVLLGGNVSEDRIIDFAKRQKERIVSTFVDYYGFKGNTNRSIQEIEDALQARVSKQKPQLHFIPYLQRHETEALWFSSIEAIQRAMNADERIYQKLKAIRSEFDTPEDINNSPETAPSKRLEQLFLAFNKMTDGSLIAEEVGLFQMRQECPRFNQWLNDLVALANQLRGISLREATH